jgi:hypothetical protein
MAFPPEEDLVRFLRLVAARRRLHRILNGALIVLAFTSTLVILASLASLASEHAVFYAALKLTLLVLSLAALARFVLIPGIRGETPGELLLHVASFDGSLGESLQSAVELSQQKKRNMVGSSELREAYIESVARRVSSISPSSVVSFGDLRRRAGAACLALVLALASLGAAREGFPRYLLSARLLLPPPSEMLQLANIEITYRYPAYTGMGEKRVSGANGDVRALPGTEVLLSFVPLGRVESPRLVLPQGIEVDMERDGDRLRGGFALLTEGEYYVTDNGGRVRTRGFRVDLDEDRAPSVRVLSPSTDGVIEAEGESMRLEYEGEDDFGIGRVEVFYEFEQGGRRVVHTLSPGGRRFRDAYTLPLPAPEGGVVEVGVTVYDNDTVTGPKSRTATVKVRLKDARTIHGNVMELARSLLERTLDVLADDIESRPKEGKARGGQQGIKSKLRELESSLSALLDVMRGDELSQYGLFASLARVHSRLSGLLEERRLAGEAPAPAVLDGIVTREINELEEAALLLNSMIERDAFAESMRAAESMKDAARSLSELLAATREGASEGTKEELMGKIRELAKRLEALMSRLASLSGSLPPEHINPDSVDTLDLEGTLAELLKEIEEGNMDGASRLAERLEKELADVTASLASGLKSLARSSLSGEMERLSRALSGIKRLEEEQSRLLERAQEEKNSMLEQSSVERYMSYKDRLNGLSGRQDEIGEKTRRLASEFEGLPQSELPSPGGIGEKLNDAALFMERASRDLSIFEISRGISNAKEALGALGEARAEAEELMKEFELGAAGGGSPVPFFIGRRGESWGPRDTDTSFVAIPKEDDAGRAFKEALEEQMKGASPPGYEELNRKYYERIVK